MHEKLKKLYDALDKRKEAKAALVQAAHSEHFEDLDLDETESERFTRIMDTSSAWS